MSARQRVALLLGAVAVAAVAFLLLRPEDEDPSRSSRQAGATQPATGPAERRPETEPAPKQPAPTQIRVSGGEPAGGVEALSARKGETVRFVVTSDAPAEVHVHGYDIFRDVAPAQPARFSFPAGIEGVFEIELEGSHTQIARLTVAP